MARTKNQDLYRFYRSNLASVVWDKRADAPLAEFIQGEFITDSPHVAQTLLDMGYPRVSLDATEPPNILYEKGEVIDGDVRVLSPGINEQVTLNKEKLAAQQAALKAQANETVETPEEESPASIVTGEADKKATRTKPGGSRRTAPIKK